MFTAELRFRIVRPADDETISWHVNGHILAFRRNGQVLSEGWPIGVQRGFVHTVVSVPEPGALAVATCSPQAFGSTMRPS